MMSWIREHIFIFGLLLLFVASFLLGVWLLSGNTFADPDSFYHIKLAEQIADGENIREFPWLPFTVLGEYYADQHFLYHIFLVPFVSFLDPFEGAKLATILLASAVLVTLVLVLRSMQVRYPLVYGFIALTLTPFLFRLHLVKAPAFSLLLLLVGIALGWKRNWIGVALVSFFYVWSYGGFIMLPLILVWMVLVRVGARYVRERRYLRNKKPPLQMQWRLWGRSLLHRKDVQVFLATVLGTIVGVITHPFFPEIIQYVNDQLIQIGIVNYQDVIGVGNEWYPFDVRQLITNNVLLSIGVVVSALLLPIFFFKNISTRTIFLFPLFLAGLFFTLKSSRYIEYYAPFGLLFVASAASDILSSFSFARFRRQFLRMSLSKTSAVGVLCLFVALSLLLIVPRDLRSIQRDLSGGFPYEQGKDAAEWLAEHSSEGDVVIHSDWDDFPYLFYWNDTNAYIAGLDPTFLYRADRDTYWAWVNMTIGKTKEGLAQVAALTFGARYVLIEKDHAAFLHTATQDSGLQRVFEDPQYVVFEIKSEVSL